MKALVCLLIVTSTACALKASAEVKPTRFDSYSSPPTTIHKDEHQNVSQDDVVALGSDTEIDCAHLDLLSPEDGGNSTGLDTLPFPTIPKLLKIGYGTQWKKGVVHWVAFPMLGLVACKHFVDLGPKMVGPKHGACQKSFQIAGKWYQLSSCNPITGMPKFLLDGHGYPINTCAAKKFLVPCIKEGMITGKGSCEGDPPEEPGL